MNIWNNNNESLYIQETIEANICESAKDAILSDVFIKWIKLVFTHLHHIKDEYFIAILEEYRRWDRTILTLENYNHLMNLFKEEEFLQAAKKVFSSSLRLNNLSRDDIEWEKYENFKLNVTVDNIIKHLEIFLLRDILSSQINSIIDTWNCESNISYSDKYILFEANDLTYRIDKNRVDKKLNQTKVFKEKKNDFDFKSVREIQEDWNSNIWNTILDSDFVNILPEDQNYVFEKMLWEYLLVKELDEKWYAKWYILINKDWELVTLAWIYFASIEVTDEWYFIMQEIWDNNKLLFTPELEELNFDKENISEISIRKINNEIFISWLHNNYSVVLFDINMNCLIEENKYISINLRYYEQYWLILAFEEWKDGFVLLNKKWQQVTPEWEYYEEHQTFDEVLEGMLDDEQINISLFKENWFAFLKNVETENIVLFNKQIQKIAESEYEFDLLYIEYWIIINDLGDGDSSIFNINWEKLINKVCFDNIDIGYIKYGYLYLRELDIYLDEGNNDKAIIYKITKTDDLIEKLSPLYSWKEDFEFDDEKKMFYFDGWFWRKRYIK